MNKFYTLSFALLIICCLWACKKGDNTSSNSSTSTNNKNIVGHWLTSTSRSKIYSLTTNSLVKDTLFNYADVNYYFSNIFIFNTDGTAYFTGTPHGVVGKSGLVTDTSSYLHYSVTGSKLNYTEDGDETDKYSMQIVSVNSTTLVLEIVDTSTPDTDWGLDMNTTYKIVEDMTYTKQ